MSYRQEFKDSVDDLMSRAEDYGDHKPAWHILAAVRGTDDDYSKHGGGVSSSMKKDKVLDDLTNHRIRAVTGIKPFHDNPKKQGKAFRDQPLELHERKLRDRLLDSGPVHYAEHYWEAVDAIKKLYQWDLQHERACDDDEAEEMDEDDGNDAIRDEAITSRRQVYGKY